MHPWIRLLRPKQWVKNAFVFAPLFFAGEYLQPQAWLLTVEAALCFLSLSCLVYILNDIKDAEEDRRHPVKKQRPIAAGEISVSQAKVFAGMFGAAAILLTTQLSVACAAVAVVYIAINTLYTYVLKHVALVDIFCIAFCYVLRVLMGGYALQVAISPWIVLTTFLLALFLGFGKRYHELGFEEYAASKSNLRHYSRSLLDRLVTICACAALITYAIYAAEITDRNGKEGMIYTVAFVAFGLFRYLQAIYVYNQGGEPESILFKDKLQLANVVLWFLVVMSLYSL